MNQTVNELFRLCIYSCLIVLQSRVDVANNLMGSIEFIDLQILKYFNNLKDSTQILSFLYFTPRFCKILQNSARFCIFCKILHESARFCKILKNSANFNMFLKEFVNFLKFLIILEDSTDFLFAIVCQIMQDF